MNTWITSLKTFFWHRHRRLFLILVGLPLVLAALAVSLFLFYVSEAAHHVPEAETTDRIVYLNKSWGDDATNPARQTYYFTPQGASMPQGTSEGAVRYQWFLHLEQPLSQARFASPEYLQRFRFLLDEKPSDMNPDHLPVGFTRHFNEAIGEEVLDITCAACHTGELHYQKDSTRFALRVDGGQAMHAFTDTASGSFAPLLMAALIETYVNPAKFDRFAMPLPAAMKRKNTANCINN